MPTVRRVVTTIDHNGDSIVASDAPAPATHDFVSIPAMSTTLIWATVNDGRWPGDGTDPTVGLLRDLPGPGETRFVMVQFPPDTVLDDAGFDPVAAAAEQRRVSPELAARFAADSAGMHTTDTVDYAIVMSGSIELELDNGVLVPLRQGDTVVQNGTRHAWRNTSDTVTLMAFLNIGRPVER